MVANKTNDTKGGAVVATREGHDTPAEGPCKQVGSEPAHVSIYSRSSKENEAAANKVAPANESNDAHVVSEPARTTTLAMPLREGAARSLPHPATYSDDPRRGIRVEGMKYGKVAEAVGRANAKTIFAIAFVEKRASQAVANAKATDKRAHRELGS